VARLKQAVEEQEGMARRNAYGRDLALELFSSGKHVPAMSVTDAAEWQFWRPNSELPDTK
jgi:hypothetical protein